ncbi:hypothetical protein B0T10DRAFT_92931 [Thelonectria olida]|uniref:Uncharacterized protein n=1 Tax=Thelonectria olida TaxID=1576542 RepID=A0A9P9AMN8_9HYPO|nr:hypothetical protein B0T10DRAFT_92931 [Thelonectria olida]
MASKVFIITGASKGIGAAITKYLLDQSHKVVITARSRGPLEELQRSHPDQVQFIDGDMTQSEMPTRLTDLAVSSFGRIDGIVINHGVLEPKRFADTSIDQWKQLYDVNVFSGIAMAKAGLNELRKSKGCIVWVSSGAATGAYVAWGTYGSAKAVYNSVSAHIAAEEPDITSVAITPGRVNTEMQGVLRSAGKDTMDKAQYETFTEAYDKGTLLRPEQPGHVMAKFVASPLKELSGKFFKYVS